MDDKPVDAVHEAGRAEGYTAYIASPQWRALRLKRLAIDEERCRLCNADTYLEVHHRRYPRRWADDCVENLTTVCSPCHDAVTTILRGRRYNAITRTFSPSTRPDKGKNQRKELTHDARIPRTPFSDHRG